ncbi:MAG: histidinol-phosphate transaminase [Acetobacteraceae bacterium]|nr:histidinol-phosphate transaminase [Acetobacteraceae bacterium]
MTSPTPRPEILTISPYVGGEASVPGVNRSYKLSSNEGAFGVPPMAQQALREVAAEGFRYPDGGADRLREAIGAYWNLDPAKIVCGAGSDDILYHLCLAYGGPGRDIMMSAHGFTIYHIAGVYAGSEVIKVPEVNLQPDLNAMLAAVTPATKAVFLANPNNPTGAMITESDMAEFRKALRSDILLVIDSAYAEYVTRDDYNAGERLVDATGNTIMTRTFSKIFGLGGIRLGWSYGPPAVNDVLHRVRAAFSVSVAAQAAGIAALAEPGWVEKGREHNALWRPKLAAGIEAAGIKVWPGEGNFVLADFGTAEFAGKADQYMRLRGLILRRVGSYGLPQCLRITVGTADECGLVIEGLAEFMKQTRG